MALALQLRNSCASLIAAKRLRITCGAVLAIAFASSASASLIVDSLRYDGSVRSGATTGVEKHFTNADIPSNTSLPFELPHPPAPLANAKNLSVTFTQFLDALNGEFLQHAILQISSPSINVFANSLDNTILLPVNFEAYVYDPALPAGQKLNLKGFGIENFNLPPFSPPLSLSVSGIGNSAQNPVHIQIGIAASQVDDQNGFAKIHFYYGTMPIPEPTTCLLMSIGLAGAAVVRGRKRR